MVGKLDSVLSIVGLLAFIIGTYDVIYNVEENGCGMTYMYQLPEFYPILKSDNGRYGLYLYDEGRSRPDKPGIPIVFIPGNAGSYKQVRSLASVALRMRLDKGLNFHFDFYSVDFNEEYSALYGGFFLDQIDFVTRSLNFIADLYEGENAKPGFIIIGHSIGGLIARSVIAHSAFDPNKTPVRVLITLATPHSPVVLTDHQVARFYSAIPTVDKSVSYVNVGGGIRDIQVRSGLSSFSSADVDVVVSSSPGIWVSTDHRCIAWCKQLILTINRALIRIVKNGKVIEDKSLISDIFRYKLVAREYFTNNYTEGMSLRESTSIDPQILKNAEWHVVSEQNYTEKFPSKRHRFYLFRVSDSHRMLSVESFNIKGNWIFGCRGTKIPCEEIDNLSRLTMLMPGKKRKAIHLSLSSDIYSYYAVLIPSWIEKPKVIMDAYKPLERNLFVHVRNLYDYLGFSFVVKERSERGTSFYNLTFPDLVYPWMAYSVNVNALKDACKKKSNYFGVMMFVNAMSKETTQALISEESSGLTAKLLFVNGESIESYMRVYLDPECEYRIIARLSWKESLGQIARFYTPYIFPIFVSVLFSAISVQYHEFNVKQRFTSLRKYTLYGHPLALVVLGQIASQIALKIFNVESDFIRLEKSGIGFSFLLVILIYVCNGFFIILSSASWIIVFFLGNAFVKGMSRIFERSEFLFDNLLSLSSKIPFIFCGFLVIVALLTCGSLSLLLGTCLHFVYLFKMIENGLEVARKEASFPVKEDFSNLNFKISLALLWVVSTLLSLPVLLSWVRNGCEKLPYDPSLYPSLIFVCCSVVGLFGENLPRAKIGGYGILAHFLKILSFLIIFFCTVDLYKVSYMVSLTYLIITMHQILPHSKTSAIKK